MSESATHDWSEFERDHRPERPPLTRRERQEWVTELEVYIERQERRLKHAGTRSAREGAERNIDQAEREVREHRRKLGSSSVVGSVYGSTPGVREGRVIPEGATDVCASTACQAPISQKEGFWNGGFCDECLWLWTNPEAREETNNHKEN